MSDGSFPHVTIIAGPTASGKSAHALSYAAEHHGVIINADSQQLYQSLPILTAQPSQTDIAQCPHVMYGILGDDDYMSAAKWAVEAAQHIKTCWANHQHPILVGGTGFYLKALLDGFSPIPDVPLTVRAKWNEKFEQTDVTDFFREFEMIDPVMAQRLHPHDKQRIIRACEVIDHTGISLATWQNEPHHQILPEAIYNIILILPPRDILYTRCNARLAHMINQGAIEEVVALDERLHDKSAPVTKAIGYPELLAYAKGTMTHDQAFESAAQMTRNYAKRQVTWFRNQIKAEKNVAQVQHYM